jgi:tetratricopeptide (TPR) repeat protein
VVVTFLLAREVYDLVKTLAAITQLQNGPPQPCSLVQELFDDVHPSMTGTRPISPATMKLFDAAQKIERGQFPEGQQLLDELLSVDPNNREALLWMKIAEARQLKNDGDETAALGKYKEILILKEDHEEALSALRQAKELSPD